MKTDILTLSKWGLTVCAGLVLAACAGEPDETKPTPEPTETADEAGADPVSIIREDVDVGQDAIKLQALDARIGFDEGGSELSDDAVGALERVLASPQFEAGGAIVLRGHTDSAGTDDANIRASQNRAEAVRDWLVEKGVSEGRLSIVAMGEQNPAQPNAKPDGTPDEEARAFNRRVDVTITVPAELAEPEAKEKEPTLVEQVSEEG